MILKKRGEKFLGHFSLRIIGGKKGGKEEGGRRTREKIGGTLNDCIGSFLGFRVKEVKQNDKIGSSIKGRITKREKENEF